eukprot:6017432-Pyramimonas_sp.AAC.1
MRRRGVAPSSLVSPASIRTGDGHQGVGEGDEEKPVEEGGANRRSSRMGQSPPLSWGSRLTSERRCRSCA